MKNARACRARRFPNDQSCRPRNCGWYGHTTNKASSIGPILLLHAERLPIEGPA